jgi:hypothetical protein
MALYGNIEAPVITTSEPAIARANLGVEVKGDFAWKEGPVSYVAPYKVNWNQGGGQGSSLNATSNAGYITVNTTGYYLVRAWQRVGIGEYVGLSLNGNRDALESRSDNLWGHDHCAVGGGWAQSVITGYLEAGWNISFGPPANYGTYATLGYAGGMFIVRLR